jgi:hypothetical protein
MYLSISLTASGSQRKDFQLQQLLYLSISLTVSGSPQKRLLTATVNVLAYQSDCQ